MTLLAPAIFMVAREDEEHGWSGFTDSLEWRARTLVGEREEEQPQGPLWALEREIAFTLGQLDRMREVNEDHRRSLLRVECYTNTELMQMEERTPRYSPYRFPEREKLQRRLMDIESERRRLATTHEDKRQALHERLLSLLNKHAQLLPYRGQPSDKQGL